MSFFVVGSAKCGTTWLCSALQQHPEIAIAEPKEPRFFSEHFDRGFEWYHRLFHDPSARVLGEGSVNYSQAGLEETCYRRILEYNAEARVLFLMREPIKRLESLFRERHQEGHFLPWRIDEALAQFPSMIESTRYDRRVERIYEFFPREHVKLILAEELRADQHHVLQEVHRFLGVPPKVELDESSLRANDGGQKYHDTRIRRLLRRRRLTSRLARWIENRVPQVYRTWRKQFEGPIHWPAGSREKVRQELEAPLTAFLQEIGRDPAVWFGEKNTTPTTGPREKKPLAP